MVAVKLQSTTDCNCNLEKFLDKAIRSGFLTWDRALEPDDHFDIRLALENFMTNHYQFVDFKIQTSASPITIEKLPKRDHEGASESPHLYTSLWKVMESNEYVKFDISISLDSDYDELEIYDNLEMSVVF